MGHSPGWDSVAGIRCKGVTCLKPRSKANRSGRRVHAEARKGNIGPMRKNKSLEQPEKIRRAAQNRDRFCTNVSIT